LVAELPADLDRRTARRIVLVLALVSPLDQIAFDIGAPALPLIGHEFLASDQLIQHTLTAYALGMTLAVLPMGLISDAVGRKKLLLTALGVIGLTSIGCALAPNVAVLLGLRFLQGIAGGSCLLLSATTAADCFRGAKLVSVLGLLGAAWGAAPVLAPAFGGFIVQVVSWRWVFAVLAALALVVMALVATLLPETLPAAKRSPIDLRASAQVIAQALRHRRFRAFIVMFGLIAACQVMFAVVGPYLYQDNLGFSPAEYGLIALVVGLANLAGALVCGWLVQRTGTRRLGLIGWAICVAGASVLLASAHVWGNDAGAITVGAVVTMFAVGVLDPLSKGLAMGVFDHNIGLITGVINTICYLFITVAMAALAVLPERSPAPLAWSYIAAAMLFVLLLLASVPRGHRSEARAPQHQPGTIEN
jgi:DHA1 family bicyclomycin/chloramphenicol resistance-like MFS transporter